MSPRALIDSLEPRRLFAVLAPDPTFGTGGVLPAEGGYGGRSGSGFLAFDNDYSSARKTYILDLRRYTNDGQADPTFTPVRRAIPSSARVTADRQGRAVVVAGETVDPDSTDTGRFLVYRYTASGAVDTTFGNNGVARFDAPGYTDQAFTFDYSTAADAEGNLYVLTSTDSDNADGSETRTYFVTRLTNRGRVDTAYGTNGVVSLADLPYRGPANTTNFIDGSLLIDSLGRVIVTMNGVEELAMRRLNPDGSTDATFGDRGSVRALVTAQDIDIDAQDRLLVVDQYRKSARRVTGTRVLRFTADGVADRAFGTNGVAAVTPGGFDAPGSGSLVVQADGTLLARTGTNAFRLGNDGQTVPGGTYEPRDFSQFLDTTADGEVFASAAGGFVRVIEPASVRQARDGTLVLTSGGGSDRFRVRPGGTNRVLVERNGDVVGRYRGVTGITADLGGGDDAFFGNTLAIPMRITGGEGDDTIVTGRGRDVIAAEGGRDAVRSGGGNDVIAGGKGNDTVNAADGNDSVLSRGDSGDDLYDLGAGNDTAAERFGNNTIYGGEGNDSVYGGVFDDLIVGGNGRDTLRGNTGNDTLQGNAGNDHLLGDLLNESRGGNDLVIGGTGDDVLYGHGGDDRIYAGNVNAALRTDAFNQVDGGSGIDRWQREDEDDKVVDVEQVIRAG